jgi:membrane protease subunit HflK
VTGDKGQNNLLYLPLDKMIESGRNSTAPTTGAAAAATDVGTRAAELQQRDVRTRESR